MNLLLFNVNTNLDHPTQAFTTAWINALAHSTERVFVLSLRTGQLAVAPNVEVASAGSERGYTRPRQLLEFYRQLYRILRQHQIDVCFSHMSPLFAVLGWPLLRARRIPILLWYGHRSTPLLLRLAHRLVDAVVTSAPSAFRLRSEKVTVIGQGVDTDHFRLVDPPPARRLTIVTVGRLSPIKNLEALIEAAAILRDQAGPSLRVKIYGHPGTPKQDRYAQGLLAGVKRRGLEGTVEFLGRIPYRQAPDAYQAATAAYNGCPTGAPDKAGLEAMAAGVPTVVINGSYRSVLEPEAGWLWVPSGQPRKLAQAFRQAAGLTPEARQDLGQRLRDRVIAQHSLGRASQQIIALLERLHQASRTSAPGR